MAIAVLEHPETPRKQSGNPNIAANNAKAQQLRKGVRSILQEAVDIKAIAYDTLKKLHAQLGSQDKEQADQARAMAQAVTTLIKGWETGVEAIRIARNKPLPGSLRPEPKPKKSKSKMPTFSETKPD